MRQIPFGSVFWRSFFMQAHWNYPRMQGTGFLFCLLPAARRLYQEPKLRIEFLKRHSGFFNAQPYCASLGMGQTLRREMDLVQQGRTHDSEAIAAIVKGKEGLCGPLGLLGDQLFWQLMKPLAAALGMFVALLLGTYGPAAAITGAIVLLLVFNPLHFWVRAWGLKMGFTYGADLSARLSQSALPNWRRRAAKAGPFVAVLLVVAAFFVVKRQFSFSGTLAFLLSFAMVLAGLKLRWPTYRALAAVALICLVLSLLMSP